MGRISLVKALLGALIALSLVAGLMGCQGSSSTPPSMAQDRTSKPVSYKLTPVKEANMASTLSYSGDVKPKTQVAITAKMVGRIEDLPVDVGSEVKAGDVIATLEHSAVDANVKQAEAALQMAKAKLAQMEAGSRAETVAQAEATLDSARQRLASAKAGSRSEAVAQAEAGLDVAQQKLASAKAGPRTEAVAQAEANLKVAEAKLAQLLAGPTPEQIEVAKTNVRLAKNQLYSIQTQADAYAGAARLGVPFTKGMKEAQSGVGYEQVQLAEDQLAALTAKPQPEQVAQAQAAVDAARNQLKLAQDPLTAWDIAQLEDGARVAEEQLNLARSPYTEWDVAQLENTVRSAEQQVKLAKNPYTDNDLDVARAQVQQAQAALDATNVQLADATIVAPFDGVVSERTLSVGSMAAPGSPIVSLISSELEISLSVEEARSGMLKEGQASTVQVAAYPGQNFDGKISSVAPTVDPKTRTLVAKVSVKDDKKQLKAGMYARVAIATGQQQTGLLVPKESVVKRGDKDVVFTMVDGKAKLLEVQAGPSDGSNIQILKGVTAGESVIQNPGSILQDGDAVEQ